MWQLHADYAALNGIVPDLDAVFGLQGETLSRDKKSDVIRIQHDGVFYYVKRYHNAGGSLRSHLGTPRIKSEWLNLQHFATWGIPTAQVVGWGMETRWGLFRRGAMITRGIDGSTDLAHLAKTHDARLHDADWLENVSQQLADITRTMHQQHFAHNDLKWRNLLVDDQARLFLIDCPSGSFWYGPFLRYRIIKDIACLDKVAKYHISRSRRLRFYMQYARLSELGIQDKSMIRRIIEFFNGRE